MKTAIVLVVAVVLLSGCALTPQTPAPAIPELTTSEAKACARTCQSIYAQCNLACSQMVGGAATAQQRKQCLNNCNQTLADCYSTCK